MKIVKMNLNFRVYATSSSAYMNEYTFIYTKTPAVLRIGDTEHRCTGKSAVILNCGTPVFYHSADRSPLHVDIIIFKMNSSELQFFSELNIPFDTPIYPSETVIIQNTLKSIQTDLTYNEKTDDVFADCALRMIFINLSKQLSHKASADFQDIPHFRELKEIHRKIHEKPMERWNIDELCEELGISRTYFHKLYFSAFGITCMQDVIECRLSVAEEMLLNTSYSISCIAELCGYDSDSYFMRQFKKHTGCTPSEYRRKFSSLS